MIDKFIPAMAAIALALNLALPAAMAETASKPDMGGAMMQEQSAPPAKPAAKTKAKKGAKARAAKDVANKTCPIGGQPVGSMQAGSAVEHDGYRVGLCCDGCRAKFATNPDAYLKAALASVGK